MAQKPRTPLPKKWIILLTVIIVIVIVGALLATYKPPELTMTVKDIKMTGEDTLNLTLTFTTKDVNVTSDEYKIKVVARRTVGDAPETKTTVLNRPLEPIPPESTVDQVFIIEGVGGYTDLNIQILKGNKQVIFQTQRIPIII